jgi:hypothetical protein
MLVSLGILSQLALYRRSLDIDIESVFSSLTMDTSLLGVPDAQILFTTASSGS